ncbi:hypothetical protein HQ585_16065 [candidate division KSB1 bacterium]|nr:hypothetical protein [candidate division KSB1 bacterium]
MVDKQYQTYICKSFLRSGIVVLLLNSLFSIFCQQSPVVLDLNESQQNMFDTFVHRLQSYPRFSDVDVASIQPGWQYESTEKELAEFIKKYDLKKVAGTGPEMERLLNLMDWVHQITDSQNNFIMNPDTLNARAIIQFQKKHHYALNCWMKSIVLNEILLAFGYKSRRISCMPSQFDGDTHSIVTIYSPSMKKWICLDPTFNTFFHDGSGNPLGYLEIREAYCGGRVPRFRSIQMQPFSSLMLFGIAFESYDQWYTVYMAKNAFQASCPQASKFNYESTGPVVKVHLIPEGFAAEEEDNPNRIFTTNALRFFEKPE